MGYFLSENGSYCTVKLQERVHIMDDCNLDLDAITYYDGSKSRHYVKCGGGGKPKCGKYKYWKDPKTEDEVINFLTLEGWAKTEEDLKSQMWRCPKCSSSPTTLEAKRLVWMLIEESYDICKKTYKSGESDRSIADVSGMAEPAVKEIRLEWFGKLAVPDPSELLNNKLDVLTEKVNVMLNDFRNEIEESSIR